MKQGYKRIKDLGVFGITGVSSLWAYIWLFIVVGDSGVTAVEAWITFIMFFILICMAFGADKYHASKNPEGDAAGEQEKLFAEFTAVEIYRELIREQQGQADQSPPEVEKR